MTPKVTKFCHEYPKDCDGKNAAIRAGFSPKSAKTQASHMLSRPEVKKKYLN